MTYTVKRVGLLLAGLVAFASIALTAQAATPIVNAGSDQNVNYGQSITLAGSAYDPSGGAVTYSWFCTAGSVSNTTIAQPVYTAPSSGSQSSATCTLTARDQSGLTNYDSTIIYINGNGQQSSGNFSVQTSSYTYSNGQAMLNGYLSSGNASDSYYVWFQWGTTTAYGTDSFHQLLGNSATFSQLTFPPALNQTYHFRAVGQSANTGQIMYGADMTFCTGSCGVSYNGNTYTNSTTTYNQTTYPTGSGLGAATYVSTGLFNNNLLTDSFFLPLVLLIGGALGYSFWKS